VRRSVHHSSIYDYPAAFQELLPEGTLDCGCMFSIWLLCLGVTATLAAANMYIIARVSESSQYFRRLKVRAIDVVWPFLFLRMLNLMVLVTSSVQDPLKWTRIPVGTRIPVDSNFVGQTTSSYGNNLPVGVHQESNYLRWSCASGNALARLVRFQLAEL
jgi:hypothetical protein